MAAARRGAAWLLPADRRDWVAAVWAEAHEVPPGLERLAWRVGGVWMLARGALMPRRLVRVALFAVAAAVAAWAAWPDSSVLHAAADRFGVIATVLLLAGLPLLARRFFGPVGDGWAARFLRVGGYAAILALIPARAVVGPYPLTVPQRGPDLRVFIACRKQYPRDAGHVGRRSALAGRDLFPGPDGLLRRRPPLGDLAAIVGDPGHAGRRHRRGPAVRPGHVLGGPARTRLVRQQSVAAGIAGRSARGARVDPAVRRAGGGRGARRPVGTAADRAAPSSWPGPGSARVSWPGSSRTWSVRCSLPFSAPGSSRC